MGWFSRGKRRASPHTRAELAEIRKQFGPGADIALKSIHRITGAKYTVAPRSK